MPDTVQPQTTRSDKDRIVMRLIFIEGAVNLLVVIAKVAVGFSAGSIAILADAVHSLTDLINNLVAVVVIRISAAPPDREHPYGHRKFETLAVFGLATLLAVMAVELILHAFRTQSQEVVGGPTELGIMLAVLAINTALAIWQKRWANRMGSDILRADASHTFSDVLTTIVVIGGWQLSVLGYFWLDKLCAIGVALLVLRLAVDLFKRAAPILVDRYAIAPETLKKAVLHVHGVRGVAKVRSRNIGNDTYVDLTIEVDGTLSTAAAHRLADQVEEKLERDYDVFDTSVHIEPYQHR